MSLIFILLSIHVVTSIKVVVFLPGTTSFERKTLDMVAQQLAFRYHETATFKGILIPEEKYLVKHKLHDVRELVIKDLLSAELYKPIEDVETTVPWYDNYDTVEHDIPIWNGNTRACQTILDSDLLDKLKEAQYEVALVYAGNPCHLAIVHAISMPFIYFDLSGFSDEISVAAGVPFTGANIPSSRSTFSQIMNWQERWKNAWFWMQEYTAFSNLPFIANALSLRHRIMDGPISELFRNDYELKKRFPYFPNVNQIKQKAELFFVNSDPVLEFSGRVTPPNVIYVGGLNVEPAKQLYEVWNETMSSAEDGVIIASLGTQPNTTAMPEPMRNAFIDAFGRMPKSRIFWRVSPQRWEGLPWFGEVPSNVNISAYFPQNDMLASKHTKLLITNGGISSIMEAMEYGVPILGIPLYGINYNNMRKVQAKGFGVILDKKDLTADSLYEAIQEILNNPKYRIAARDISRAFRARLQPPLDTAISWIEYVGRNNGVPFLKSAIEPIPLYKQLMLDVLLLCTICSVVVAKFVLWICNKISTRSINEKKMKNDQKTTKKAKLTKSD